MRCTTSSEDVPTCKSDPNVPRCVPDQLFSWKLNWSIASTTFRKNSKSWCSSLPLNRNDLDDWWSDGRPRPSSTCHWKKPGEDDRRSTDDLLREIISPAPSTLLLLSSLSGNRFASGCPSRARPSPDARTDTPHCSPR